MEENTGNIEGFNLEGDSSLSESLLLKQPPNVMKEAPVKDASMDLFKNVLTAQEASATILQGILEAQQNSLIKSDNFRLYLKSYHTKHLSKLDSITKQLLLINQDQNSLIKNVSESNQIERVKAQKELVRSNITSRNYLKPLKSTALNIVSMVAGKSNSIVSDLIGLIGPELITKVKKFFDDGGILKLPDWLQKILGSIADYLHINIGQKNRSTWEDRPKYLDLRDRIEKKQSTWADKPKYMSTLADRPEDMPALTGKPKYMSTLADRPKDYKKDPYKTIWKGSPVSNSSQSTISTIVNNPNSSWEAYAQGAPSSLSNNASTDQVKRYIVKKALEMGVDPAMALAIAKSESGFGHMLNGKVKRSLIKNKKTGKYEPGAVGVMQLMPGTAKGLGVDPFDINENILGGLKYLKNASAKYSGDLSKIASHYNAGPGAVKKYGGIPPYKETQNYVRKVTADYQNFARQFGGVSEDTQLLTQIEANTSNIDRTITDTVSKKETNEGILSQTPDMEMTPQEKMAYEAFKKRNYEYDEKTNTYGESKIGEGRYIGSDKSIISIADYGNNKDANFLGVHDIMTNVMESIQS